MEEVYLDSNVFIFAANDNDPKSIKARKLLTSILKNELIGATSVLSIDEFVWKISKIVNNRNLAIQEGLRILDFRNLKVFSVDNLVMKIAFDFMLKYNFLKPRDAIHLAVAYSNGIKLIISDDSEFDKIKEVKRRAL